MGTLHSIITAGLIAAEEAGHQAGGGLLEQLGIRFPLIFAQAAGFIALFFFLRQFAFRPVLNFLDTREEEIRTRYADAERAHSTAEQLRRDYEARLSQIEAEARDRIQEGIREGQAMRAELLAQAHQERERIIQQGHREVNEEREKMIYLVRETVANMAVDAAARVLSRSLDEETHRSLVREFLEELPASAGGEARA